MRGKNLLRTGMFWSLVAAICCFTPILVVLFVGVGLSAFVGWLDYALFPILFAAMGLVAQALWLNSNRAGASPRRLIIIAVIMLSALLIWLQFRFALSISLAAAGAVLFYGLYLRRPRTS